MMMMTPTKFKPVILKNVCSKTYLDVFMHMIPSVELWENKEEHNVNYKKKVFNFMTIFIIITNSWTKRFKLWFQ